MIASFDRWVNWHLWLSSILVIYIQSQCLRIRQQRWESSLSWFWPQPLVKIGEPALFKLIMMVMMVLMLWYYDKDFLFRMTEQSQMWWSLFHDGHFGDGKEREPQQDCCRLSLTLPVKILARLCPCPKCLYPLLPEQISINPYLSNKFNRKDFQCKNLCENSFSHPHHHSQQYHHHHSHPNLILHLWM